MKAGDTQDAADSQRHVRSQSLVRSAHLDCAEGRRKGANDINEHVVCADWAIWGVRSKRSSAAGPSCREGRDSSWHHIRDAVCATRVHQSRAHQHLPAFPPSYIGYNRRLNHRFASPSVSLPSLPLATRAGVEEMTRLFILAVDAYP